MRSFEHRVAHNRRIPLVDPEAFHTGEWHVPPLGHESNGTLTVMLPGFSNNALQRRAACQALVMQGDTVVAVDGFRHGARHNAISEQAEKLDEILQYLDGTGQPYAIDAHSMGCATALSNTAWRVRAGDMPLPTRLTLHASAGLDGLGLWGHMQGAYREGLSMMAHAPFEAVGLAVSGLVNICRQRPLQTIRQAVDAADHDATWDLAVCLEAGIPVKVVPYEDDQLFRWDAMVTHLARLYNLFPELLTLEVAAGGHNAVNDRVPKSEQRHARAA